MRIARLVILVCVAVLASCDSTDPGAPSVVLARATGHDRVVEVDERLTVSVRAINRHSKPVAGVTVIWGGEPGGNIDQSSAVTAADGIASTEVRVRFGVNRILARIQGTPTVTDIVVHGCSRCGEWSRAPLDVAAMSHAWGSAAAIGDQIWVVGGATRANPEHGVSVFDPTGATWRRTLDLPTRLIGPVTVAVDGNLYVIGGAELQQGFRSVAALDVSTAEWTGKASLLVGRYYAAGAVLDGKIYVVGGHDMCNFDWCPDGPVASLEIYDPAADRWTSGPPLLTRRAAAGAVVLDGKLYIAGGTDGDEFELQRPMFSVEMFDPAVGRWVSRADLPVAGPTRLAVLNGTLYAFASSLERQSTLTYEYDVERDAWNRLRDAPGLLYGSSLVAANGGIYALGGFSVATNMPFAWLFSDGVYVFRR